jgi:DNA-binding GntR family transcriptional regulator
VEISWKIASFDDLVLDTIRDGVVHCGAIAKELDSSPATVSKAARRLEAEGKISRNGRKYQAIESPSPFDKEMMERGNKVREEMETREAKRKRK